MKRISILVLSATALVFSACTSTKDIVYMQDIDQVKLQEIISRYEAKIKKDDMLSIVVSGPDKQVVMPYNLTLSDNATGTNYNPENASLPYLVDINGDINFPILGKIHVEGMTRSELSRYLTEKIAQDVKDPIVYISFRNYKITVLGEVRNPGTYTMDSEKTTLFQALGKAGDLTLNAMREDIVLIREINGVNSYFKIDLTSADLLNKDYFYMQQNDVLYIPPSAKRIRSATTNTGIWSVTLSSVTTVLAVVSLVFTLTK
ncbi:MAG: polysaccharide biosynthesis/export family protein [Bacteroidales bacterium]|nr:polysaccharide biosynthesis/export family protein [Bacteroidales bacterium]